MWTIIAILLAAALVTFLIVVVSKPNSFRLQRSITISAPPEAIYPYIADFNKWPQWSPWEKLDPNMTRSYGGPAEGLGATYDWSGTGKAGTGRMEIIEASPSTRLLIKLQFVKPFKATNSAEFTLQPQDGATVVTWAMFGPSPFITKLMHTFFSMEAMVGPDFEAGLKSLKSLSEGVQS